MASNRPYRGVAAAERKATRRRQLLDAGFDLLAERGTAGVTVSAVCQRAGLTARYFYEHFSDRDVLLSTIFETEAQLLIAQILEAAQTGTEDPQQRAEAAVLALLDALDADPRRTRLGLASQDDPALLRRRAAIATQMSAAMIDNAHLIWGEAPEHPERLALAVSLTVGGVLEIVVSWLAGKTRLSREELARICARFTITTATAILSDQAIPLDG